MASFSVDGALCSGHGLCAMVAPAVFSLDSEGFNAAVGVETAIAPGLESEAEEGAQACPDQAIRILG
jgi:ferredoxin